MRDKARSEAVANSAQLTPLSYLPDASLLKPTLREERRIATELNSAASKNKLVVPG